MNKKAILSRFKETNETYHNILSNSQYDIIIFNKNQGENLLPNVGRESHTYLHYIIENYDNLPDEILLSQFDAMDHFRNNEKNINDFLNAKIFDFIGIGSTDYDLRVINREIPWLKIYRELYDYEDMSPHYILPTGTSRYGVFRVTKQAILRHNKQFYIKCIDKVSNHKHPPEGFFFERAWKYIFTMYGNCPKDYSYIRNSIWLFGPNKDTGRGSFKRKDDNYGHIKLYPDGCVSSLSPGLYKHENECFWTIENHTLHLLHQDGKLTSSFKIPTNNDVIKENVIIYGDRYCQDKVFEKDLHLRKPMWT